MDPGDIPLLSMLKERMSWLNRRQEVLSENVANADVPGYKARDLKAPDFEAMLQDATASRSAAASLSVTNSRHFPLTRRLDGLAETAAPDDGAASGRSTVSLEEQMIKVADTQAQFQAAANLYAKAIEMMKTAIGRSGS